ncbi:RNA polymerase sigma factor CarQ [Paraconexibacter sp. AEG42_29]|uniref:RNA polymerase sigma factor CarQ n=1 Tax=Paraconexibacter sp. AEG42_29 TaxID=2997339 RepID=A0AAU7AT41_9ACTN
MISDAALVAAAREDPEAFRAIYDRYAHRVHAYFARRTRDADAAHDLTAETFAQAWLVRARFRDEAGGSAGPWLFGIARNVLLMSVRRGRLEQRACERLGLHERLDQRPADAVPELSWADDADTADELLASLPPAQREAVRLRVVEDLGYTEVAAALGTSAPAARVRVHRGLAALRARATPSPTVTSSPERSR